MNHLAKLVLLSALVVFAIGAKYQAHRRSAFSAVPTVEWLTNYTTGTLRADLDGWVGCYVTPRNGNITVTALGRWVIAGNSQTHTVKVLRNGLSTIASASINTVGATAGQVRYTDVTPFTLTNGVQYVIASQEFNLGDQWYNNGAQNTALVRWDKGTCDDAVYSIAGTTYSTMVAGTNSMFVPVSFKVQ